MEECRARQRLRRSRAVLRFHEPLKCGCPWRIDLRADGSAIDVSGVLWGLFVTHGLDGMQPRPEFRVQQEAGERLFVFGCLGVKCHYGGLVRRSTVQPCISGTVATYGRPKPSHRFEHVRTQQG